MSANDAAAGGGVMADGPRLSASRSREARPDSVSPKPELELADRATAGRGELVRVVDS